MNTPVEVFFEWRSELFKAGIGEFAFNNVGNPFKNSPIPYNTHELERETVKSFAKLFDFKVDNAWGFLSHSGTDSNMHGMYMGRTVLKGRTGVLPKAYFTREAHYSVQILQDHLGLERVFVETFPDGGMDPEDLAHKLAQNANAPALVVATMGTTFKGAVDRIDLIQKKLLPLGGFLHLDAALFGGYLPFTPYASEVSSQANNGARPPAYDSIAVSCHKFFGFPSPAGLFITRQDLYDEFNTLFSQIHNPEYIQHVPGTITCSRDAVKPAEFYYFTTPTARDQQVKDAEIMLTNSSYLLEQLNNHLPQLAAKRANPLSNTIYFKRPSDNLVEKYSLATMNLTHEPEPADYAHVVVMPHVTRDVLTELLTDLEDDLRGKTQRR
ncbi:MAG: pyridoxal-dependent decarboxylase [Pirellulaceae bacterium]|nr:pyridoxal-dependent decarboxylase [Pirellulaceae bacterium]